MLLQTEKRDAAGQFCFPPSMFAIVTRDKSTRAASSPCVTSRERRASRSFMPNTAFTAAGTSPNRLGFTTVVMITTIIYIHIFVNNNLYFVNQILHFSVQPAERLTLSEQFAPIEQMSTSPIQSPFRLLWGGGCRPASTDRHRVANWCSPSHFIRMKRPLRIMMPHSALAECLT